MQERMAEAKAPSAPVTEASFVGRVRGFLDRRLRRRSVLIGGAVVGGVAVGVGTGLIDPKPIMAAVLPGEKRKSAETLTFYDTYSNALLKKPDGTYDESYAVEMLSQDPTNSPGNSIETDSQGNMVAIHMLYRDKDGKDHYIFTKFNPGSGTVTPVYKRNDSTLPIYATGIFGFGNFVGATGETSNGSGVAAVQLCNKGGADFQSVDTAGLRGEINIAVPLDGTNLVVLNLHAIDAGSGAGLLNVNSRVITKPEGANALTKDGLIVDTSEYRNNKLITYATVSTGGYVRNTWDLLAKTVNSEPLHADFKSLDGFTGVKDASGRVTKLLMTDNGLGKLHIVDAATNNRTNKYDFRNWLDGKGIVDYDPGSLSLNSLLVIGDYVWAGGTHQTSTGIGENRAVLVAWKLGEDPAATLEHIVLAENKRGNIPYQQSMKAIKVNGVNGIFSNVRYLGPEITQVGPIGEPIKDAKKLWLQKLSLAQSLRMFLPGVARNNPGL